MEQMHAARRCHALLAYLLLTTLYRSVSGECSVEQLSRFPGGWPKILDIGVYWYGPNDEPEKATKNGSRFFDPSKPTLIFVHGWTGYGLHSAVTNCRRWSSRCAVCPDHRILSTPWLESGWNFGMFYWDQFTDEPCIRDVELKVWDNPNRPEGLLWKSYDNITKDVKIHHYDLSMPSMGPLCAQSIEEAMPGFTGPTLRIVGHSLGAQLASHCSKLLHVYRDRLKNTVVPSRLVLLDPVFSGAMQEIGRAIRKGLGALQAYLVHCSPINDTNLDFPSHYPKMHTLEAIAFLWQRGVPTELYKGSLLSMTRVIGDPAWELETVTAYVVQNVDGGFCQHDSLSCGHSSLVPLYMDRIDKAQPYVEGGLSVGDCTMPGPACSDQEIRTFMNRNNELIKTLRSRDVWHQVHGIFTVKTIDDNYSMDRETVPTDVSFDHIGLWQSPNKSGHPKTESHVRENRSHWISLCVTLAVSLVAFLCILGCCRKLWLEAFEVHKTAARNMSIACLNNSHEETWELTGMERVKDEDEAGIELE